MQFFKLPPTQARFWAIAIVLNLLITFSLAAAPFAQSDPFSFIPYEQQLTQAVKEVNPAVISILIMREVPISERYEPQSPLRNLFQGTRNAATPYLTQYAQKEQVGGGSGFFVSPDGLIVTNKHIASVKNASFIVVTNEGKKYEANVVAIDPFLDIAILKIKGEGQFPYLEFGNSDQLELGQPVISIGNALGEFRNTVSAGIISGLSRSIIANDGAGRTEQLDQVIQTDAAINPGNSGGPLLTLDGKVIGVNVALVYNSENIGFALPGNVVQSAVESVKARGEIIRPYLGVRYVPITEAFQEFNNLPVDYGVLITKGNTEKEPAVLPRSPADKAGIKENDIILEIDNEKITPEQPLSSFVYRKKIGETISATLWQKGGNRTITILLEQAPKNL